MIAEIMWGRRRAAAVAVAVAAVSLSGLAATPADAAATVAPVSRPAAAATCWATHYGAEIPPGSYTASGEIFQASALAAATSPNRSPQLPFGTRVKVTNTANGASVTVRVNDRGAFASPVCLDLTDGAFERLAPLSPDPGHIAVTQQVLS